MELLIGWYQKVIALKGIAILSVTTGFIWFTLLGFEPASHSSYRAKGVKGFTAQDYSQNAYILALRSLTDKFQYVSES